MPTKEDDPKGYHRYKISNIVKKALEPFLKDSNITKGKISNNNDLDFLTTQYTENIFEKDYRNCHYNTDKLKFTRSTAKGWYNFIQTDMVNRWPGGYVRPRFEDGPGNYRSLKELEENKNRKRGYKNL